MASTNTDIYDELWVKNQDIADSTLHTPFLQHMQLGDLQADNYVKFIIQDINYLVKVTDMLEKMCKKVKEDDLREFMKGRYESYKKYADDTLMEFNLKSVSDIKATPAMKKYLSDYEDIMNKLEPIYFAVALLPCSRLWLYLANQLNETCCNAYFTWKMNNMYGHPEDHYRKLLDKRLTKEEDKKKAQNIFRQQMQNEHEFFASSLK